MQYEEAPTVTRRDFLTKWFIYALALLPVWFLEVYVLSRLKFFGVSPMLLPVAAVTVAVLEGSAAGGAFGLAVGVICDAVYHTNGAMTLGMTLLGAGLSGLLGRRPRHHRPVPGRLAAGGWCGSAPGPAGRGPARSAVLPGFGPAGLPGFPLGPQPHPVCNAVLN